jgi:hypothetical protein
LSANLIGVSFLACRFFICFAFWTERNQLLTNVSNVVRNIGNARFFISEFVPNNFRLQGLEEDLGMTGDDYNIALCLFFITYPVETWDLLTAQLYSLWSSFKYCPPKATPRLLLPCSYVWVGTGISHPRPVLKLLDHGVDGHC